MTNKQIAYYLNQIADLLELQDANIFEVRAYQNASRAIEGCARDISDLARKLDQIELENVQGIGPSIAENIIELVNTGKIKKLQQLIKKIPSVQIEMLKVPGLGPKLTKKLFKLLKPKSLADLKYQLKKPKNQTKLQKHSILEKSIKKFLSGIKVFRSSSGRMLLSDVLPIARQLVKELKKLPEVEDACFVGSLRRTKETVGDIDLIASSQSQISKLKPACRQGRSQNYNSNFKIIRHFLEITNPKQIIAKGESKATVINQDGVQIDLEITPKAEWGSLLHHFTGSKEHNIKMRAFAETKGLSFSEHGFKKIPNPKSKIRKNFKIQNLKIKNQIAIYCPTEEKVFQTLNLQYIPPELREGTDEIEKACARQIPKLIEIKDIQGDLQMHSTYSDGKNKILKMARASKARGLKYICISDHSAGLGITGGINARNAQTYLNEIKSANQKVSNMRIFSGIEVNIKPDGSLDQSDELLKQFDIVLGAVHTSLSQSKEKSTTRILKALAHPLVKILVHPTSRLIEKRPEINADWLEIFRFVVKNKKILEINAGPDRLDLKDTYIHQGKELGAKFAIDTDAHSIFQLDFMQYGILTARRGWLEKADVINALPLTGLKKALGIK